VIWLAFDAFWYHTKEVSHNALPEAKKTQNRRCYLQAQFFSERCCQLSQHPYIYNTEDNII